jgi:hypothetical protein
MEYSKIVPCRQRGQRCRRIAAKVDDLVALGMRRVVTDSENSVSAIALHGPLIESPFSIIL